MKIIILIISNDSNPSYLEMQNIWRNYMNLIPNITTFFIKSNPNIENEVILNKEENTIYIKDVETYMPGIFNKTIASIKYCLSNMSFDYIYRTNLSSFLDLNKMYSFFLSNKINYGGVVGDHNGITFSSGCGFIMSKEVCNYLVTNAYNNTLPTLLDDVVIGYILNQKYPPTLIGRNDILNIYDKRLINKNKNFHYRCKTSDNHTDTCQIMQILYYNIYV